MTGGYDSGYLSCPCFWGTEPSSLVREFLRDRPKLPGWSVLDLGCGEGKNAIAFAAAGATVVAVDCSAPALKNAKKLSASTKVTWVKKDVRAYLRAATPANVIVMYGLLHCLPSEEAIRECVQLAQKQTTAGGFHILATFDDGPHDLSAHPDLSPTLKSHDFFLELYSHHRIRHHSSEIIHETHPNNGIPHFHSLTRMVVEF